MSKKSPIVVALDVANKEKVFELVEEIGDLVAGFKVGLELVHREGLGIIREINGRGGKVFYDGKFHDIPNTVAQAVRACVALGVWMLNIHSLGGREMMEEAVRAVREEARRIGVERPLVLAVTILTSLGEKELSEIGIEKRVGDLVAKLASLAKECGCDGVIASPREIRMIRELCGEEFLIVTPGIRLDGEIGDHKRFATPKEAIKEGANYLVIGRPILKSDSPRKVVIDILKSLEED